MGLCRAIMEIPRTHLRAGPDIGFALTVGVSQAFSIIVAGITGSIEPWPLRGDQWIDIWIYSAYSYDTHISEHMISSSHRYFIYFICKGMCCMYKYSHTHTYRYTYIYIYILCIITHLHTYIYIYIIHNKYIYIHNYIYIYIIIYIFTYHIQITGNVDGFVLWGFTANACLGPFREGWSAWVSLGLGWR